MEQTQGSLRRYRRLPLDATGIADAYQSFERVCTPAYDGFLTVLAELLGWDTEESPGIKEFGQERVKGTQEEMPEGDKPTTKLQALFDMRPCFTAIRRGFSSVADEIWSISREPRDAVSNHGCVSFWCLTMN